MSVKVKICGITNIADARAAADAKADMIGFMFYEGSKRHITVETAELISRQLRPDLLRVGVFVNPTEELVATAIQRCGLGLLQFHGQETPGFCRQFGVMSMKAFRIQDASSLESIPEYDTDAYLLDSYVPGQAGGTGEKFNWALAAEAARFGRPIFLAGGLTPQNVAQAIQSAAPFAVDVSSGVEITPGNKDHKKIREFIDAAKRA